MFTSIYFHAKLNCQLKKGVFKMRINLIGNTGEVKQVKLGVCWTFLFFRLLVPLFRGDIKWFFIILFSCIITIGFAAIYFLFKYNEIYLKGLLAKGYKPADEISSDILKARGLFSGAVVKTT